MTLSLLKRIAGPALIAAMAVAAPLAAQAKELVLYNWTDYIPPDLLKRFTAETGIAVTLDQYDSNETLLAKLKAGGTGYDVIVPSDYMIKIMIDEKLLQEIDTPSMPNFKYVEGPLKTPYYDPGRKYSSPYMYGTTSFAYDTAAAPKLEDSWKEFFEPREELRGKIGAMNDMVEMINNASRYVGVPLCSENPAEMKKVQELLLKQKPFVALYNSDGIIERMTAKEVVLHMQWNGGAHRVKADLPTVTYVYPKEGMSLWADNLAIPVGAKNVEEAKIFINWMLEPKNIAEASNFTGYMSPITASSEFLEPTMKTDPAVVPPEGADKLFVMAAPCSAKAKELMDKVWTNVKK
ncbi:extracellular solute-binding protein [Oleomonas cavernae]|uniref:extracellular solute-binding protein n=1 Tax=Oleomonas cavernae TaxID=2320859 RepID=UPI0018F3FE3B|nr:extracellular solute-binding protein [Oleomonas cavernae]